MSSFTSWYSVFGKHNLGRTTIGQIGKTVFVTEFLTVANRIFDFARSLQDLNKIFKNLTQYVCLNKILQDRVQSLCKTVFLGKILGKVLKNMTHVFVQDICKI